MTPNPHVPASEDVSARDTISRKSARKRVAIASAAAAGVAFIAAGLLAGPSLFPRVLDELRERELLPVHIIGTGGSSAAGQNGSEGSAGSSGHAGGGSGPGGSSGNPASQTNGGPAPSVILPGGTDLKDMIGNTTDGLTQTVENTKTFVKETVQGVEGVVKDPSTLPGVINDTVNGAKELVDGTVSTLPVTIPSLPVTAPTVPNLPVTVPTVPTLPVTVPPVTAPPATVPSLPVTVPALPVSTTLPSLGGLF